MGPNAAVSTSQKKRGPVVMRVPGEDVEERRPPPYHRRRPRRIERVERSGNGDSGGWRDFRFYGQLIIDVRYHESRFMIKETVLCIASVPYLIDCIGTERYDYGECI